MGKQLPNEFSRPDFQSAQTNAEPSAPTFTPQLQALSFQACADSLQVCWFFFRVVGELVYLATMQGFSCCELCLTRAYFCGLVRDGIVACNRKEEPASSDDEYLTWMANSPFKRQRQCAEPQPAAKQSVEEVSAGWGSAAWRCLRQSTI